MEKQHLLGEALKERLDHRIHSSRNIARRVPGVLAAYDRIVSIARARTPMLARKSLRGGGPDVNAALLAMALHRADWLSPVESWTTREEGTHAQLASLAEHLFARYPMPRFMVSAWLEGEPGRRTTEHRWYKLLGTGGNIRRAGIPMRITRAMAHRFLRAPDHLTPIAALRWAQVVTLGGEDAESLARAIIDTRLGRAIDDGTIEAFWESVVFFFVHHPELDLAQVGPIVDFLQHPAHRGMTMKGRTPASMLRLVEEWHIGLGKTKAPELCWPRASIGGFSFVEKLPVRDDDDREPESRLWTITELCSSKELVAEGRAMRHCVATYAEACVRRWSSIWSVQMEARDERQRVMTVEVDPSTRRVRQARAQRNLPPSDVAKSVLARWAERERLDVPMPLRV
jgi:hypothetical protein